MNILHINNTDLAGGRFNGFYMKQSLDKSFNVEMVVWNKESLNSNVHRSPPKNPLLRFITLNIMRISARLGFDGLAGFSGWVLPYKGYFKRADVIHLHLIHNHPNFSILSLPMLSRKKPVVWTIHDPWAMTGGCEHSFECNRWMTGCKPRCPHPRIKSLFRKYTPFLQWKIKKSIFQQSNLTLVVASKWMKDRIERSPLLSHLPCHLIPFGIDLQVFKPLSKVECRKKLGISSEYKVIAFRGIGIGQSSKMWDYKGIDYLIEALKIYDPKVPTVLLIFENGNAFQLFSPKYSLLTPGWIDGEDLVTALSAADLFLMPSIQEAFGLMAIEAMACGTPVIVFEGTSLPDVIKAPLGGLAVPAKDSFALAKVIKLLMENDEQRISIGKQARIIAESEYSIPLYIQRHISLYNEVIDQHQSCSK
jgi:glycosyltransferase involved in cell wall biosynthesis